jgi:NitT/TauT family transport system substrate-binding protein
VARAKQWFEEVGVQPEMKILVAGAPLVEGLVSKNLDMGWMGTPGMIAVARGFPLRSVMGIALEGSGVLAAKREIRKIEDLRGRIVGLPVKGSIAHILLWKALKNANVEISSVRIVEIPDPLGIKISLQRGEIDAVAIWEPWATQLELDKVGRILGLSRDIWPNHQCDFMWISSAFLEQHPEQVKKAIDAVLRGMQFIARDFGDAAAVVSQALKVPIEVERVAMRRQVFTPVLQRDNIRDQYEFMVEVGLLKREALPPWERLVDVAVYDYALKRWDEIRKS